MKENMLIILIISFGVFITILGAILFIGSLDDCISCSILDEECPEGYDTEENNQCLGKLMFKTMFFMGMFSFGLGTTFILIASLICKDNTKEDGGEPWK